MLRRFFDFYWRVYVPDHAAPANRWVHFLSNIAALTLCTAGLVLLNETLFMLGVWFQLGPPYLGHLLFEKTHRSIDQDWFFAAVGSWYTTTQILLGRQCVTHGPAPMDFDPEPDLAPLLNEHGTELHAPLAAAGTDRVFGTPDGGVAFVEHGAHRVAAGAPLGPDRAGLARAFAADTAAVGRRAVFFGVGKDFVRELGAGWDALEVGRAPVWAPREWDRAVAAGAKLRNRLNRGRREGIVVVEEHLARHVDRIGHVALAAAQARILPPMAFVVSVDPALDAERRRLFVARRGEDAVGYAICAPVPGRRGWLVEHLLAVRDAPAGTTETLVDGLMRALAHDGAELVTLGMVALAGVEHQNHALAGILTRARRWMRPLYDFDGLRRFRNKLIPGHWEPVYLAAHQRVGLADLLAVLRAFADGQLVLFAANTAARWVNRRVDLPTVGLALGAWATIAAAVALGAAGTPWPVVVAVGTLGTYAAFTPVHEAAHGNLARWRWLNEGMGHVGAWLIGGALRPYRWMHGQHHRHTGVAGRDPDLWVQGAWYTLPWRWLTIDLAYLLFYARHQRPWREWAELGVVGAAWVTAALLAAWAGPGWLRGLLLGWMVPARLALVALAWTFTWLPHREGAGETAHAAHHRAPRRRWWELAAAPVG